MGKRMAESLARSNRNSNTAGASWALALMQDFTIGMTYGGMQQRLRAGA